MDPSATRARIGRSTARNMWSVIEQFVFLEDGFIRLFDPVAPDVGGFSPYSGSADGQSGWANYTFSDSSDDISFIVVGGDANDRLLSEVKYDARSVRHQRILRC